MTNILITGGAGYIGSVMTPYFLNKGYSVTVLDNLYFKQISLLNCFLNKNFNFINGDTRDYDLVKSIINKFDVIIPLACLVGAPICKQKPIEAKSINFDAINSILKLKSNNQILIFPTTNSGYGTANSEMYCNENSPLNPISLYGKLKADIESKILQEKNTITLRLATVFGLSARMRLDLLVNDFVYRAVKDKFIVLYESHFKRNFVHIVDVVRAFDHCLENFSSMKGETFNVGLEEANLSKYELCLEIKKLIPDFNIFDAKIGEDPDKRNYIVSNQKIIKSGFNTQISLAEGINELVNGYKMINQNNLGNV